MEASNRFEPFKSLSGLPHLQDVNYSDHQKFPSSWPVDNFSGPQGCILLYSHGSFGSQTAQISGLGQVVPVCGNAFCPSYSSQGVDYLSQGSEEDGLEVGHLSSHVPRRLAYQGQELSRGSFSNSNFVRVDSQAGVDCKQGEVGLASKASVHLIGPGFRPVQGCLLSYRGQVPVHSGLNSSSAFQPLHYSTPGYAPFGSSSFHREVSTSGSPSHAPPSVSSQETFQLPPERCPGFSILLRPFSEGSSKVVVTKEQCHGARSTAPTQICNIHLHGCLSSGLGSSLCSHDCPRSMVDSGVQTAHQCFGAQGCAPGSQDLCSSVIPSIKDYPGGLGQHNCLCLHKQTRGHLLFGHVCPDLAPVCLLSQEQGCSFSKACSRGHESCGRPTLQVSADPSHRVVSQSPDLQVVVSNRLPTPDRSVCNKIKSQASSVCLTSARSQGSGNRCPGDELVWTSSLLLPSYSSLSTCGQKVHQLSELQDASCGSSPGNQEWLQDLLALSIRRPVALPLKENLLKQPHLEEFHQNLRSLNLLAFWLKSP